MWIPMGEIITETLVFAGIMAVFQGSVNLGVQMYKGNVNNFRDGAIAFGIGALSGAVSSLAGGVTYGLGGFIGGFVAGAQSGAIASLFQGLGNHYLLGDKGLEVQDVTISALSGGLSVGMTNGLYSFFGKNTSFWNGSPRTPQISSASQPNPASSNSPVLQANPTPRSSPTPVSMPNPTWPPNNGALDNTMETIILQPGKIVDRYGEVFPNSTFVAEFGTPIPARSLSPQTNMSVYNKFLITAPIENVERAITAPWFGQPGMGVQYNLPILISTLIHSGKMLKLK